MTCYRDLDRLLNEVDGAVIITNPRISLEIVKSCKEKGITDLWFQLETMDDKVRAFSNENGLDYINSCVLLHNKESGFPHSLYRLF
ncbi:MAG: CoA-binding protein, partial [bacterium]